MEMPAQWIGQRVLDACCAPGGKTCHILEAEPQLAGVVAVDLEAKRLVRVRENLERLGLSAELIAADGRDTATWWDGKPFQRILLDAPCSATGVIRRHPDIKLTRQPDDIAALASLQGELLDAMWQTLEVGGILLGLAVWAWHELYGRWSESTDDARVCVCAGWQRPGVVAFHSVFAQWP